MDASDAGVHAAGAGGDARELEDYQVELCPGFPPRLMLRLAFRDGSTASVRMPPALVHRMSDDLLRAVAAHHGVRTGPFQDPET